MDKKTEDFVWLCVQSTANADQENPNCHLEDCIIKPPYQIKILGITIDFKLKFNSRVSELCRKAATQLNAAQILKTNIDEETRMEIYRSFILSNFNYCPLVWHLCSKYKIIEKGLKIALRFIYMDFISSHEECLTKQNHSTLYITRLRYMATELYKCMNGLNPTYL